MLSLVSGCNLVASKASWSFSGSEGQLTDTGSQGRTFLSQKTSGNFGAVKKAADTEFAGGYSIILILVCVSASLRFRFLTCCKSWKSCAVALATFSHQPVAYVRTWMTFYDKQNSQVYKDATHML